MPLEILTIALLLAVAAAVLALALGWRARVAAAVGLAALVVGGLGARLYEPPAPIEPNPQHRPLEQTTDGYVSSRACGSCHPGPYQTWDASYHSKMTQAATPATVLAPFDGTTVEDAGQRWVVEQRGDEFWVEIDDLEWRGDGPRPRVWRQIVQTTGSHHFQFYWYATGHKRELAILHIAWALGDNPRWIPLDSCCISPPQSHYEAGFGRWSWNCIRCHATHGKPRIAGKHDMDTRVAELGIACEACHGPGSEHVATNRDPLRRYDQHASDDPDETIVNPARLDHRSSSMICGNCHSVNLHASQELEQDWNDNGYAYRPGGDWTEWRELIRTGRDRFWSDGAIRVSGREYNGLVETPCFQRGEMSCLSCHTMHQTADDPRSRLDWADDQLTLGKRGDEACTQCHASFESPRAIAAHTHHPPESSGSRCYNCHMPYTTYGLLKGIRTHQLENPSVATSLATGRPNGCNQCHLDRTLAWTAEHLDRWYDIDAPSIPAPYDRVAASVAWTLLGDPGQRALMAWSMGWDEARDVSGSDWMSPYLILLLNDPYDAVRHIAQRTYDKQDERSDLVGYDFTMAPQPRLQWMLEKLDAWVRAASPERTTSANLLIQPGGVLDVGTVDRLLDRRDKRDLTLNE